MLFFKHIPSFTEQVFLNIQEKYEIYNFLIVFKASFTPKPFKIIPIFTGFNGKPFGSLLPGSTVNSPIW